MFSMRKCICSQILFSVKIILTSCKHINTSHINNTYIEWGAFIFLLYFFWITVLNVKSPMILWEMGKNGYGNTHENRLIWIVRCQSGRCVEGVFFLFPRNEPDSSSQCLHVVYEPCRPMSWPCCADGKCGVSGPAGIMNGAFLIII